MNFAPLGDLPTTNRKPYIISPRPRNLFGHCYMPPSIKKKYLYAAVPPNYSPKKRVRNTEKRESQDGFLPCAPISTMTHTPRPLKRTPAEIREEQFRMQVSKIDLSDMKKEVEEYNQLTKRLFEQQQQTKDCNDKFLTLV